MFSTYPHGLYGAALLLLRVTISLTAFFQGVNYLKGGLHSTILYPALGLVLIICGVSLLIGFLTQLFSVLICVCALVMAALFLPQNLIDYNLFVNNSVVHVSVIAISLALMGPGAFSLDAYIFGRREIIIPDN